MTDCPWLSLQIVKLKDVYELWEKDDTGKNARVSGMAYMVLDPKFVNSWPVTNARLGTHELKNFGLEKNIGKKKKIEKERKKEEMKKKVGEKEKEGEEEDE